MEAIRPLSRLHKDYVVTSLRREMACFQQLMETLESADRYEVVYIEETLKSIENRLRSISRSLNSYN